MELNGDLYQVNEFHLTLSWIYFLDSRFPRAMFILFYLIIVPSSAIIDDAAECLSFNWINMRAKKADENVFSSA
jgi:hypothetical protein